MATCVGGAVWSPETPLPAEEEPAVDDTWSGARCLWHLPVRFRWNGCQLSLYAQHLAHLHVALHHLSTPKVKGSDERWDISRRHGEYRSYTMRASYVICTNELVGWFPRLWVMVAWKQLKFLKLNSSPFSRLKPAVVGLQITRWTE